MTTAADILSGIFPPALIWKAAEQNNTLNMPQAPTNKGTPPHTWLGPMQPTVQQPVDKPENVAVTVTPQPTYGMEWTDWASLVFPPALLWKATDPTPVGGAPMPATTVSGEPGAVSEFLSTSPLITTTEKDDPFAGLTDISNMVMKIAPVLLVFALIGGLKKVF